MANAGLINPNDAPKSYEERITNFLNTGKNNELVVEPGAVIEPQSDKEMKREIARIRKAQEKAAKLGVKNENATPESKVDTGYIIDNVVHAIIEVDKI